MEIKYRISNREKRKRFLLPIIMLSPWLTYLITCGFNPSALSLVYPLIVVIIAYRYFKGSPYYLTINSSDIEVNDPVSVGTKTVQLSEVNQMSVEKTELVLVTDSKTYRFPLSPLSMDDIVDLEKQTLAWSNA